MLRSLLAKGLLTSRITLFTVGSVQNDIQVDQIEICESLVGARLASGVEVNRHLLRHQSACHIGVKLAKYGAR
jgi:hypothetical protein